MPAGVYPRVGGDGHDSFDISKLISRRWITAYLDTSDITHNRIGYRPSTIDYRSIVFP